MKKVLSFIFLVYLTFQNQTSATTLIPLTLEDLVQHSDIILHGVVLETRCVKSDDGRRFDTLIDLGVIEGIYGVLKEEYLTMRLPGGRLDGLIAKVDGVPEFEEGEEVILFCQKNRDGEIVPVGFFQGKFNVTLKGEERFILQERRGEDDVNWAAPYRDDQWHYNDCCLQPFITSPGSGWNKSITPEPVPLKEFVELIRALCDKNISGEK